MDFSEIDPVTLMWAGLAAVSIMALVIIWKIARWKGELDRWKREVNEWRENLPASSADSQSHSPGLSSAGNRDQGQVKSAAPAGKIPDRSGAPVTPIPQTEMALLYALTERRGEACTVAEIENDTAVFHHDLGNLLYRSKRFEEAEKEYREALRLEPDFARAHANLGFLLKRLKRGEESAQEFEMALASKEQLPDSGERIMKVLQEMKES
ncbi:MAG: tetratricopeptide repeat protein [Euryarchaeota archaeon]|nr:tetratricopeptide repeat protein [Euryarchaeota archaeon]